MPKEIYESNPSQIVTLEKVEMKVGGVEGKRVAVFCSSSSNLRPEYVKDAQDLGSLMAERGCALVYGGGSWGLMGEVAKSATASNAPTIVGVLPDFMQSTSGPCYGQVIVVKSMAERKATIDSLADVFIALPGGFGTLDEITEMLTWNQIGINNKLIGILNTLGFYDDWWRWVQRAVDEGFIKPHHMNNVIIAQTPGELLNQILTRTPKEVPGKFRTRA